VIGENERRGPMTSMTDADILNRMRQLLDRVNSAGIEHHKRLAPDWTIDDLGCDSVTTLEIITDLETFANVEIADEDLLQIRTIGDLVALIQRGRGAAR
jgi:acyl carrier protein